MGNSLSCQSAVIVWITWRKLGKCQGFWRKFLQIIFHMKFLLALVFSEITCLSMSTVIQKWVEELSCKASFMLLHIIKTLNSESTHSFWFMPLQFTAMHKYFSPSILNQSQEPQTLPNDDTYLLHHQPICSLPQCSCHSGYSLPFFFSTISPRENISYESSQKQIYR